MPTVQTVTRTVGQQCMGFLGALADFLCSGAEVKRTQLAMLGKYENNAGFSAGFFRSGFAEQFVDENVVLQDGNGKIHEIILTYLQRCCTSDVTQTAFDATSTQDCDPCTAGTVDDYREVKIDTSDLNTFCKKVTFQNSLWITRCEDPQKGMMRRFMATVDALLCLADQFLIQSAATLAGANTAHPTIPNIVPDETLIAEYQQIDIVDSNENPIWSGVNALMRDIECNELQDCPIALLFGIKGNFATYARAAGLHCCNDRGEDLEAIANATDFTPFKSKHVQAAFTNIGLLAADAANAALMLHPGTVHLLEVFKYAHHPFSHGNSSGIVWTDPLSGEMFDLKVYFNDCTEVTTLTLAKHVGVFVAPTDQYKACDDLENVNGVLLYNFTQA